MYGFFSPVNADEIKRTDLNGLSGVVCKNLQLGRPAFRRLESGETVSAQIDSLRHKY